MLHHSPPPHLCCFQFLFHLFVHNPSLTSIKQIHTLQCYKTFLFLRMLLYNNCNLNVNNNTFISIFFLSENRLLFLTYCQSCTCHLFLLVWGNQNAEAASVLASHDKVAVWQVLTQPPSCRNRQPSAKGKVDSYDADHIILLCADKSWGN